MGRSRVVCTRTERGGRAGTRRSERARSRVPARHSEGRPETPARRSGGLAGLAIARGPGRSRAARGRPGAGASAREIAARSLLPLPGGSRAGSQALCEPVARRRAVRSGRVRASCMRTVAIGVPCLGAPLAVLETPRVPRFTDRESLRFTGSVGAIDRNARSSRPTTRSIPPTAAALRSLPPAQELPSSPSRPLSRPFSHFLYPHESANGQTNQRRFVSWLTESCCFTSASGGGVPTFAQDSRRQLPCSARFANAAPTGSITRTARAGSSGQRG